MALIIDRKTKKKEKNMKATNTLYQEENNMKVCCPDCGELIEDGDDYE